MSEAELVEKIKNSFQWSNMQASNAFKEHLHLVHFADNRKEPDTFLLRLHIPRFDCLSFKVQ